MKIPSLALTHAYAYTRTMHIHERPWQRGGGEKERKHACM
jgi:uncharacterized membrane protein